MVGANAVLTFAVEGTTGGVVPIDVTDLRSGVVNMLGHTFDVLEVSISKGSTLSNIVDFQWFHWQYSAVVRLRTRSAFAYSSDVASIVRNAFYQNAKALPTVTVTSEGETQGPGVINVGAGFDDVINNLAAGLGISVAVLVIGVVGIAALIAYGPNVKSIAAAVR